MAIVTTYQMTLDIDFGQVGYSDEKSAFNVRLDATPLRSLIDDARSASRVYELLLIDRPGDVWNYVHAVPLDLPKQIADRVARKRAEAQPRISDHPWPEDRLPFLAFDALFDWCGDDTAPEEEAWLQHRDSEVIRSFARSLLAMVKTAQQDMSWNDPLLAHIVQTAKTGEHQFAYLDRAAIIKPCRISKAMVDRYSNPFYDKLGKLLRDENLTSVAYRGGSDRRVLRMMATEQRRRANLTGHRPGNALFLGALGDGGVSNEALDSEIWFFSEGLSHGDLFIECGGTGASIKRLVEEDRRRFPPGRYILSTRHEGVIDGFELEEGEGWFLYRRSQPDTRRRSLAMIDYRRNSGIGRLMTFNSEDAAIFGFEKTLVFIGPNVAEAAQNALVSALKDWCLRGGDAAIVTLATEESFHQVGCPIYRISEEAGSEGARNDLEGILRNNVYWVDAAILLGVPEWAERVFASRFGRSGMPWHPWIVSSTALAHLKADLILEGDLAENLIQAAARTKAWQS